MATAVTQTDVRPACPICMGEFNKPRQLPCAHSFCQSCLQSYVTSKATEHEKKRYIECPVCRQATGHFKQNKSISDWASLFPSDTVLQSMLPTKSKVERVCDACSSEGTSVTAIGFCAVCEEAMCDFCLSVHRKQKVSKSHTILTNDDLLNNLQHVMKFSEGIMCFEHDDEDLKFYCSNHKIACCGICLLKSHKTCSNVKVLKDELPALLRETETNRMIEELKKLETHLNSLLNINESNMTDFESQVNGLADQISEMRKKMNTALDELEMKVMMEGRRIQKEVVIRTQKDNHQCQSLIHAIRNSQLLCETVYKYGIDIQKFLTAEKIKAQLPLYYSQVRERIEKTGTLTLHVQFTPLLESILSLSSSSVGKLVTMTSSSTSIPGLRKKTKECKVEKVETFNVDIKEDTPCFSGVAILPKDRVMLVDYNKSQCILLNNLHKVVATFKLTERPFDICVVSEDNVAVSSFYQNSIQILSVRDDVISQVRTITTKYECRGIAAAENGEMIVVEHSGDNKSGFSLISDGSEVSYDSTFGNFIYIALNNSKTRVYVTVPNKDSLHFFNLEGKIQYTYSPDNLRCPLGVAVDRDDNIYVIGYNSHNIHQLSPEGYNLQVISVGVPHNPRAISFDKSRDTLIFTNDSESKKVDIYKVK